MLFKFLSDRREQRARADYAAAFEARAREKRKAEPDLDADARAYHRAAPAGKMETVPTKRMASVRDLSLAYSPGVAAPCLDIAADPDCARALTNKAGLVAVVSNGTAVLGLGDIGALAAKPVMEGKAALFRRFAGLNAVDLCIDEKDPARLAAIVTALEPSFGGVNLEDIKAPDCFEVERLCRANMSIPAFHDDQHGTAVVVLAAVENALKATGRRIDAVKVAVSGAGAAGLACLDLLVTAGVRKGNIIVSDKEGVVYQGRKRAMDPRKAGYAVKTGKRKLSETVVGADLFLGVSAGGVLTPAMVETMAPAPII
ncbi:MAG: malic enzyme-like NAD(P)-binding protein, partial [Pseudomonadota bacterium]